MEKGIEKLREEDEEVPSGGPEEVLRLWREKQGRLGGLGRAAALSAERRSEIARMGGRARGRKK